MEKASTRARLRAAKGKPNEQRHFRRALAIQERALKRDHLVEKSRVNVPWSSSVPVISTAQSSSKSVGHGGTTTTESTGMFAPPIWRKNQSLFLNVYINSLITLRKRRVEMVILN